MKKIASLETLIATVVVASAALAQDPSPTPAPFLVAMLGTWAPMFTGLDVVSMACIGWLSFLFTRSFALDEQKAILIPTGLGLLYGVLDAWMRIGEGWQVPHAAMLIFKGLLFNGAGATVIGRVVALLAEKWWPSPAGELKAEIKRLVDERVPKSES